MGEVEEIQVQSRSCLVCTIKTTKCYRCTACNYWYIYARVKETFETSIWRWNKNVLLKSPWCSNRKKWNRIWSGWALWPLGICRRGHQWRKWWRQNLFRRTVLWWLYYTKYNHFARSIIFQCFSGLIRKITLDACTLDACGRCWYIWFTLFLISLSI